MEILLIHSIFQDPIQEELDKLLTKKLKLKQEKNFILSDVFTVAYIGKIKSIRILKSEFKNFFKDTSSVHEKSVMIYYNGTESKLKREYIY
jgi:hypothetical protein